MMSLDLNKVSEYVAENIGSFHNKRLARLSKLKLNDILKRKNPYLFKAKNILTSEMLIKSILNAHLSSNEETIFGEFLEGLAIYVAGLVHSGRKSAAEGIDLELDKGDVHYIVAIKSGPNWANSSQKKRMIDNFKQAKRILRTQNSTMNVIAVNGCCYGKDRKPDKGDHLKLCGQRFWDFISDEPDLYIKIIKPLETKAKQKNAEFEKEYAKIINKFTLEFSNQFCTSEGEIDWPKLVRFNSGQE